MSPTVIYRNGQVFDGNTLSDGLALRVVDGVVDAVMADGSHDQADVTVDLDGQIISPGYTDLQVNGGGGVQFNDDPSVASLRTIADAHRRLGVNALLPTLITDTREKTEAAITAVHGAVAAGVPGIAGLHLEGPHLSVARKGAHEAASIRPMEEADLQMLLKAREALPFLKVTIAPESVSEEQVAVLSNAGICVSLGHTDADFDTCLRYARAGVRCVTHLFNAMSQLGSRAPGLVGAALQTDKLSAGLIADLIHVHPASIRAAWRTKPAGSVFLVSDAMAVAGTDVAQFSLNGRFISRKDQRLTLSNGTLAGADLDLTTAVRNLVTHVDVPLDQALAAATSAPAGMLGKPVSSLVGNKANDLVSIRPDLSAVSRISQV